MGRPGGTEWNAAQRPENVQNHGGVGDETSFKAIRPPPSGSKLSFGAVLTTPVAAKRVLMQSGVPYWRQNEFRSRCGLIRTYESSSYDKSRTQKQSLSLSKRGQTRPLCRGGNDFTTPKLVSLPTGPSRLLRNSFFNQKGHTSTPQNGSRPSRAPGNEAATIRGRAIPTTTRAAVKRASVREHKRTRASRDACTVWGAAHTTCLPTPYRVT